MNFDLVAPHYRWMEFVLAGRKLQRCRTTFLDRVGSPQNVLSVGEGNGRFVEVCRRRLPNARITVVDSSSCMLSAARARLARRGVDRVDFVQTNALEWKSEGNLFDLIVTHFFLDCFRPDQLPQVVANLAATTAPNATWLLADFQIPPRGVRHYRARIIHALMYVFFRVATRLPAKRLTPPDDFLKSHNFVLQERQTSDWGLLRTDLWRRTES